MSSDEDNTIKLEVPSGYHDILDDSVQLAQRHPRHEAVQLQSFRVQTTVLLAVSIASVYYAPDAVTLCLAGLGAIVLFFTVALHTVVNFGLRDLLRPYHKKTHIMQIERLIQVTYMSFFVGLALTLVAMIGYAFAHDSAAAATILLLAALVGVLLLGFFVWQFAKAFTPERNALRAYRDKHNVFD
jgi:hypothetical protein